jgi:hypothetical protein
MPQIDNLKIILDGSRDLFQEMTYKMPERISEKGFRWLTLYTLSLGALPGFASSIIESLQTKYWQPHFQIIGPIVIALSACVTILFFVQALRKMLFVVHIAEKDIPDFRGPLKEVWNHPEFHEEALLYEGAMQYIDASDANLERSMKRTLAMRSSYRGFYIAIAIGVILYLLVRTQQYYFNGI